ncbi:MAG: divergent PAP2 family protein [Candidatus Omnitrophica bacterium]|nr:divergent PAP2 family protein [Candidatus Omnitrophota bacterium]
MNCSLASDLSAPVGHKILFITLVVWAITQTIKVALGVIVERRFDFRWFIGTGGMPSSHAAGVTALAVLCGLNVGFNSVAFALASVFALVTMFDAQGVRRATGHQAEVLNKIVDDIYRHGNIEVNRLKELIGHTPFQVFVGSLIGFLLAVIFYNAWIKSG